MLFFGGQCKWTHRKALWESEKPSASVSFTIVQSKTNPANVLKVFPMKQPSKLKQKQVTTHKVFLEHKLFFPRDFILSLRELPLSNYKNHNPFCFTDLCKLSIILSTTCLSSLQCHIPLHLPKIKLNTHISSSRWILQCQLGQINPSIYYVLNYIFNRVLPFDIQVYVKLRIKANLFSNSYALMLITSLRCKNILRQDNTTYSLCSLSNLYTTYCKYLSLK